MGKCHRDRRPWQDKKTFEKVVSKLEGSYPQAAQTWGIDSATVGKWGRKHGYKANPPGPRPAIPAPAPGSLPQPDWRTATLINARTEHPSQNLLCFFDLHNGAFNADPDLAVEVLERYPRENTWILLGGDLAETSTRYSVGAGVYEQKINPQHQYEQIVALLEPHRKNILGLLRGNHEDRIYKTVGMDFSKMLARELKLPYLGYSGNLRLDVGTTRYVVFATHGATGATTRAGRMRAVEKLAEWNQADLYLYGHTHDRHLWTRSYRAYDSRDKTMKENRRWFCLAGSFLHYDDSYAEMKNYEPLGVGIAMLELSGTEKDIGMVG